MKIYFAGGEQFNHYQTITSADQNANILAAYSPKTRMMEFLDKHQGGKLFLDSGAFSAFTQGIKIDLDEYIEFIKGTEKRWEVYATLDVIGDYEGTMKNMRYMESKGIHPLPVFHNKSPLDKLEELVKEYDYIALGGLVPLSMRPKIMEAWLDKCFSIIRDRTRVHGFGVNSYNLMKRYPFYSVDATSWLTISQKLACVLRFEDNKLLSIGGLGKNGEFIKEIKRYPNYAPKYKDNGETKNYLERSRQVIREYIKVAEFITKLWEFRGVKWED